MARSFLFFLVCLGALRAGADPGPAGWAKLKTGMTPEEAVAALGEPLLQSKNRGFILYTYSDRAEVVFYRGPLIAWTAPKLSPASTVPRRFAQDVDVLPGAAITRRRSTGPQAVIEQAYAYLPTESRFRYSPRPFR